MITHGIEADRGWNPRQGIALFGLRQHWPLIIQPSQVTKEDQHQQDAGAHRDINLVFGEVHRANISVGTKTGANKVTLVSCNGTCTPGRWRPPIQALPGQGALWPSQWSTPRYSLHGPTASSHCMTSTL